MNSIYLDHNSSTPLAPEVFDAMRPFLVDWHGNAASAHAAGARLGDAVDEARAEIARLLGASVADEIVFTSGGTESNNWVMNGVSRARRGTGRHLLISAVEHLSILESTKRLVEDGYEVTAVGVAADGRFSAAEVLEAVRSDTILVSLILAQNEVGSLQPVADVARHLRSRGISLHTDASQAVGKIPIDVDALGVDLLTVAGHKLYGPKGIGALYVRRGTEIAGWMLGAAHEKGRRAGTVNVPAAVGLGRAASLAAERLPTEVPRQRELSRRLWERFADRIDGLLLNGPPIESNDRLPNTVNVSFPGWKSYDLLPRVPDVFVTAGAACHSGDPRPSSTLLAMGFPIDRALGAVRFSLGRSTTAEEIDQTVDLFTRAVSRA